MAVHENYVLIDHELLSLELYLNGLQHLNTLQNVFKSLSSQCSTRRIVKDHEQLGGSLDLHGQVDPVHYYRGKAIEVLSVAPRPGTLLDHVGVELNYPINKLYVKLLDIHLVGLGLIGCF